MAALQELEGAYAAARKDKSFRDEYQRLLHDFAGRPTPLFLARAADEASWAARRST